MTATLFEIVEKRREEPFSLTDIRDFRLRESGQRPAERILESPHITLYSLDWTNRRAVLVETPATVNLSRAPFFFVTQYEEAIRVWTIPFETMIRLAEEITIDGSRLIVIHSTGRSGSTLAGQIFAQIPGVVTVSEPDVLTLMVVARHAQPDSEEELKALLKASVCLQCKTPAERAWVLKGRSYIIEIGDWLHEIYPESKNLFLYRDAETWLRSCLASYGHGVGRTEEERRAEDNDLRAFKAPLIPAIAQIDSSQHLSRASIMSIEWLAVMERYAELSRRGIEMLAIRFADWHTAPRKTARAMLDYCQCAPDDLSAVYEALTRDSQAGTVISREAVKGRKRAVSETELEQLRRYLSNHDLIHAADFEAPNTLRT